MAHDHSYVLIKTTGGNSPNSKVLAIGDEAYCRNLQKKPLNGFQFLVLTTEECLSTDLKKNRLGSNER